MNVFIWGRRLALAVGALFLLAPSPSRAEFLPVNFVPGGPTVTGSNGSINYIASTGDFNATLSGASLAFAAPFVNNIVRGVNVGFVDFTGSLSIDLTVDQNGNFVASGAGLQLTGMLTISLSDGGTVTFGTSSSSVLLSGTITAFGTPQDGEGPPTQTFSGFYTVTGGLLTQTLTDSKGNPVFGGFPLGAAGGFLLPAENVSGNGTLGDFAANFFSTNVKPEIGLLTPEPSTLVLSLTGGALLVWWRRPQFCRQLAAQLSQPSTLILLLSGTVMRGLHALNFGRSGIRA
jgi:hypothetical protein